MIRVGDMLPEETRCVCTRDIILGATASRDWQPQHHDHHHAVAMKLPGIIMNAPTLTGWFHAYALRWAGGTRHIARWRLTMRRPICPDVTVRLTGSIDQMRMTDRADANWIWLDLSMEVAGSIHSTMRLLLFRGPHETALDQLSDTIPPLDG